MLVAEDWPPNGMDLDRNLTIRGNADVPPLLDLNFIGPKVQLGAGVRLTFSNLVMSEWRSMSAARAPGFNLLANKAPKSGAAPAVLHLEECGLIYHWCASPELARGSAYSLPRPEAIPGVNVYDAGVVQRPDCLNDTYGPLLERCWPQRNYFADFACPGIYLTATDAPARTGYLVHLQRVSSLCNDLLPLSCIRDYSALGCDLLYVTRPDSPARPFPTSSGVRANHSSSATGTPGSAEDGANSAVPQSGRSEREAGRSEAEVQEGSGDDMVRTLGLAVGCALGGALVLVLAAMLVLQLVRRRGSRRPEDGAAPTDPARPGKGCRGAADLELGSAPSLLHSSGIDGPDTASNKLARMHASTTSAAADTLRDTLLTDTSPYIEGLGLELQLVLRPTAADPWASPQPDVCTEAAGPVAAEPVEGHDSEGHSGDGAAAVAVTLDTAHMLGKGGFSRVYQGGYRGERVAVKVLEHPWGFSNPSSERDWKLLSSLFQAEVQVLGRVSHPIVVRLLAACVEPPRLALVMELCETSLERLIYDAGSGPRDADGLIPLPTVLHIGVQICQALSALHPTCMHRDLKPANVLLNHAQTPEPVAKITDFGLSRVRCATMRTQNPEAGTVQYLPPECFDLENEVLTCQVDMYSLGVLLWEALSGQQPWKGCSTIAVAFAVHMKGMRPPIDAIPCDRLPPKLLRLLQQCWERDPKRRPAAAEAAKGLALAREQLLGGPRGRACRS
ncbi:hypothetical protein HYH03_008587 [Edaphochlamys debaryana]|uniref:Protein kinase domain-containing protein n=1 Tax=Edaphochlamys debaryana TaxID=47281 RepID=A0A836BY34_9CHLO|nr:hypothetical protein HYH03_008587 [Edaphochlamys debaryana]|eukprot:KAG2493165.1 hypothetical protein HYH03_008587 [Edaphochlamys debaryana]